MTRQAWLSLPLSVLIVLVAGVALSGTPSKTIERPGLTEITGNSGITAPEEHAETIDDVALRVFGTRDAAGLLLDANP